MNFISDVVLYFRGRNLNGPSCFVCFVISTFKLCSHLTCLDCLLVNKLKFMTDDLMVDDGWH